MHPQLSDVWRIQSCGISSGTEHFTDSEKKTISRIETMGIKGDECEEILRARGKEVTRPPREEPEAVLSPRKESEVIESGSTTVIYGSDDIANYQYNMIENPGPLAEIPNQPAKNFYGGRYNMEVLQEDRIMYRAGNA